MLAFDVIVEDQFRVCWSPFLKLAFPSHSLLTKLVTQLCRTLNYMSNKCPFMAESLFFHRHFLSQSYYMYGAFLVSLKYVYASFCLALWYRLPVEVDACRLPADLGLECHTHTHTHLLTSVNLVVCSTCAGCMPCIL